MPVTRALRRAPANCADLFLFKCSPPPPTPVAHANDGVSNVRKTERDKASTRRPSRTVPPTRSRFISLSPSQSRSEPEVVELPTCRPTELLTFKFCIYCGPSTHAHCGYALGTKVISGTDILCLLDAIFIYLTHFCHNFRVCPPVLFRF